MIRRLARKAIRKAQQRVAARPSPPRSSAARPSPAPSSRPAPATSLDTGEAVATPTEPAQDSAPPDVELDHEQLKTWREDGRALWILDIREAMEVRGGVLAGSNWIPMNSVPSNLDQIPRDQTVVVVCAAGQRSFGVAHWLREQGVDDAWSLVGGVGAGVSAGYDWQAEGPR